jgi:hypothetical protein
MGVLHGQIYYHLEHTDLHKTFVKRVIDMYFYVQVSTSDSARQVTWLIRLIFFNLNNPKNIR